MEYIVEFLWTLLYFVGGLAGLVALGFIFEIITWETISEGKAVSFEYLGGCRFVAMQFTGRCFPPGCSVEGAFLQDGVGPNYAGSCWCIWMIRGVVFYIPRLVRPTNYLEHNNVDGFGEGIYVFLHDLQENFLLRKAETRALASGATVAPDIKGFFRMRVANPYLFQFKTPKEVVLDVVRTMARILVRYARTKTSEELQTRENLWPHISGDPEIAMMKGTWGVEILPDSPGVSDIDYGERMQKALEEKAVAALEAEAEAARITAIDQAMDAWVAAKALALGISVKTATKRLMGDGDPSKQVPSSYDKQRSIYMAQILPGEPIRVSNADGSPLTGDLGSGVAYLGALSGVLNRGGRRDKQRDNRRNGPPQDPKDIFGGRDPKKMTVEEIRECVERQNNNKGGQRN